MFPLRGLRHLISGVLALRMNTEVCNWQIYGLNPSINKKTGRSSTTVN